ncbi:alternate-type signal peptide domain-containing protein [Nocardioides marmoriginsengisoli]|uniref:Alternate-type signal peptide domain-containing protein n=1 Tax=Nocardioides marmoriginsengisoli TaxID=661483 RepID=A0A3N0CHP1_9ACTN|nr:alternate-type signal peptide domain-containing protein [Nocardioides marmoriginsengisoli]RNL62958.1 alternate-type signal peptide domain-containing protein [Nocardioides marmoriginsengisoli]
MNKSTKGALAATAAGVLLLGGVGSLAYWSDSATIAGGAVNSGTLSLTDATAGSCATAAWTLDSAESPAGIAFDPATDTLVPGDVLTKRCSYTIGAVGEHLRATVVATGGVASGDLAPSLQVAGGFTIGGSPVTEVTEANDGDTLVAEIQVRFDAAADNTTRSRTAALGNFVVTLSQVHD